MRRKRPKVVWLPNDKFNRLGTSAGTAATSGLQSGIGAAVINVPPGIGSSHTEIFPLVQDNQIDSLMLISGTLADYAQSAYRLRRIVGKIFIDAAQEVAEGFPTSWLVTAGIIVLRTHQVAGLQVPLNAVTEEYSTTMLQNWSDPWIWRRTWHLGNIPRAIAQGRAAWAENNANGSGSALDGPHVDAKTARVIGPEERLFLVITSSSMDGDVQIGDVVAHRVQWDLRVLASMRSSQGNRRNASR